MKSGEKRCPDFMQLIFSAGSMQTIRSRSIKEFRNLQRHTDRSDSRIHTRISRIPSGTSINRSSFSPLTSRPRESAGHGLFCYLPLIYVPPKSSTSPNGSVCWSLDFQRARNTCRGALDTWQLRLDSRRAVEARFSPRLVLVCRRFTDDYPRHAQKRTVCFGGEKIRPTRIS